MSATASRGFRRSCLAMALVAVTWSLPSSVRAEAYPLQEVSRIVDQLKPNVLIVLETAESMQGLPAENPARYNEVGADCEDGNRFCRLVGQSGRWRFSGMGRNGMYFGVAPTTCTSTDTYEYADTRTRVETGTATQTTTDSETWNQTSNVSDTATATATGTGSKTESGTASGGGTQTVTGTVSESWTVTATATPSATGTLTAFKTVTVTSTAIGTGTVTHSQSYSSTGVVTLTKVATASGTVTQSAQVTAARTATASQTATRSVTKSGTATGTGTVGGVGTVSVTSTVTVTGTPTITRTLTLAPTGTATGNTTVLATATQTGTQTVEAIRTQSKSATLTVTGTVTGTVSGTGTVTPTVTVTATGALTANRPVAATGLVTATLTANATGVGTGSAAAQWFTYTGWTTATNTWTIYYIAPTNYARTINGTGTGTNTIGAGGYGDAAGTGTSVLNGITGTATMASGTATLTLTRTLNNATCTGTGAVPNTGTAAVASGSTGGGSTHTASGTCVGGINADISFSTGSGTASGTLSQTVTVTGTGTVCVTATVTASDSGTATGSLTASGTSSVTASSASTGTAAVSATITANATGTVTATPTATATATFSGTYPATASVTSVGTETFMNTGTHVVSTCGFDGAEDPTRCDEAPSILTSAGYCARDSAACSSPYGCDSLVGDYCRYISVSDNSGHTRPESCATSSPSPWGSCKQGKATANVTCNGYTDTACSSAVPGDFCAEGQPAKMCRDSGLWCFDSTDCPGAGDACVYATSRMMTVKHALRRAITKYVDKVSFGFMSTYQGKGVVSTDTDANTAIYPYVKLTACPPSVTARETKLITRGELERGVSGTGQPCFDPKNGPSATCTIDYGGNGALNADPALNRITYTLTTYSGSLGAGDSRWSIPRSDGSGKSLRMDASWSACASSAILPACAFSSYGTGLYEGSYYYFDYRQGTPVADTGTANEGSLLHPKYFSKYMGKYYSDGSNCYNAMDAARTDIVNDGVHGRPAYALASTATSPYVVTGTGTATGIGVDTAKEVSLPVPWSGAAGGTSCGAQDGALYTPVAVPFLTDATFGGVSITRDQRALMMTARLEKASFGGVAATGASAPIGCALNPGAPNQYTNAAGYLAQARTVDTQNNGNKPPCWTNNIILVVDGHSNGAGDEGTGIDCASTECAYSATNTTLAGCNCKAITDAYTLAQSGIRTHVVVNAPANWVDGAGAWAYPAKYPYTYAFLWNLAIAGSAPTFDGTPSFGVTEEEVFRGISDKIAAATYHLPFTTTVPVAGATTQDPVTQVLAPSPYLFDTSVSYPAWKGTLRAFDTGSNAALLWDAAKVAETHPATWKERRIFFASATGSISKVDINSSTGAINNASALYSAGLGANAAEAEHIMQWLLGKPDLGNQAPLMGSVTGSAPIAVAQASSNGLNGSSAYSQDTYRRPQLVYVGGDDGMLHAFFGHASAKILNGVSYQGGEEAFAFIPNDMLQVITKLYAQGGQNLAVDKSQHVFGLASSPKVKDMCIGAGCETSTGSDWHTVLVMTQGPGGNKPFALDITNVISEIDGLTPQNMQLLWSAASSSAPAAWGNSLGETTSLPGFYFAGYASGAADNRVLFASGYPTVARSGATASQGLMVLNVNAATGAIIESKDVTSLAATTCTQTRAVLSDVAIARDYASASTSQSLLGAFVTDTWGNAYQYVPTASTPWSKIYSLGCGQPLHFAPAVAQLDRAPQADSSSKHFIYLAQVTNSALDPVTQPYSTTYPGSQLVITKLDGNIVPPAVVAAYNTANANGQIVLSTDATILSNRICVQTANETSFTNGAKAAGQTCPDAGGELLPNTARPVGTPTVVLRADGLGFQVITSWYDATAISNDCSTGKQFDYGKSYLTVHEFGADGTWYQVAGITLTDTVLTGVTFVGTGLFVDGIMGANGGAPQGISIGESFTSMQQILNNSALERYSRTSWSERVE